MMEEFSTIKDVAMGISEHGVLVIIGAAFIVLSCTLWITIFKWFKSIITQVLKQNQSAMLTGLSK